MKVRPPTKLEWTIIASGIASIVLATNGAITIVEKADLAARKYIGRVVSDSLHVHVTEMHRRRHDRR